MILNAFCPTPPDGHYLYIEANNATNGDTARLLSPECSHTGPQCLRFWYHMHGSADTMGLHVYLLQDRLAEAVWWKRNDQGDVWNEAMVELTPTGTFQVQPPPPVLVYVWTQYYYPSE